MNTLDRFIAPLRPDRDHARQQSMRSLARACLETSRALARASQDVNEMQVPLIAKGAVLPTTTAEAAALLTVTTHLLESLVPVSAAATVIARSLGLTFDHATQLSVPGVWLPAAKWVAEAAPIPVAQGLSSGGLLDPAKIAMIAVLTGEMLRSSNAEQIMRQALLESVGGSLDVLMFSVAAGVPQQQPPGLLFGVPPLIPADAGSNAMVADLKQLARAVAPVGGSGTPLLVCAPEQFVALGMMVHDVFPFVMSAALPNGVVICVVPEGVCTAIQPPRIDVGKQMATAMADPASEAVDIGGVMARPMMSSFQTDSAGLKIVLPAAWGLRSPRAIAWLQDASW
jgi:hypothetical protein